jgi:hypothetical protein
VSAGDGGDGTAGREVVLMSRRRLGLTGRADDDVERRTIISTYMEMAQQVGASRELALRELMADV